MMDVTLVILNGPMDLAEENQIIYLKVVLKSFDVTVYDVTYLL